MSQSSPISAAPPTTKGSATSHGAFMARRHFANLDGVRCISILAVLYYHMPIAWGTKPALPLLRGFLGVDLFFVISGFLITTLLLRERERHGRIALGAFYMRRTLRIFPLYFAVLGGMALWVANDSLIVATGADKTFFARMPNYLTYTANLAPDEILLSPSWSLATEEQFYMLWPPLLALAVPALRHLVLLALAGLSVAANFGAFHHMGLHPAFAAAGCTPILLGLLLAFALHQEGSYRRLAPLMAPRWTLALPLVLLGFCLWAPVPSGTDGAGPVQPGDLRGWPRIGAHIAFTWAIGCVLVRENGWTRHALRWSWVQWIGRISYGIYLIQIPVLLFITLSLLKAHGRIHWEPGEAIWLAPTFVMASIALATLSWFTFERGFLSLKHRFHR